MEVFKTSAANAIPAGFFDDPMQDMEARKIVLPQNDFKKDMAKQARIEAEIKKQQELEAEEIDASLEPAREKEESLVQQYFFIFLLDFTQGISR